MNNDNKTKKKIANFPKTFKINKKVFELNNHKTE